MKDDSFTELTGAQLVEAYNGYAEKLGRDKVKRFPNKGTGLKRVRQIHADYNASLTSPKRSGGNRKFTKHEIERTCARRVVFNVKATCEPKSVRPGTKRARMLEMLRRKRGASFIEMQRALEWNYETVFDNLYLVPRQLGYSLREDSKGRIYVDG